MVEAITHVLDYTRGGQKEFLDDRMRRDAVMRNLEILGEAAKRLSPAVRDSSPHIPWRDIAGMRDKLIHDYGQVDTLRVWDVIEGRLPKLLTDLQEILREKTRQGTLPRE